jgi:hypothetical protein
MVVSSIDNEGRLWCREMMMKVKEEVVVETCAKPFSHRWELSFVGLRVGEGLVTISPAKLSSEFVNSTDKEAKHVVILYGTRDFCSSAGDLRRASLRRRMKRWKG